MTRRPARLALALLAVALLAPGARAEEPAPASAGASESERPEVGEAQVERAIERGVAYLVHAQNPDGSWGSPASNLHDIYAPIPGSQQAFQVASSALAVSALVEVGGEAPDVARALLRGREWLLTHHDVRRVSPNTLYNVWAHAYALAAFARLLDREENDAARERLLQAARENVEKLQRFRFVEGGWGYYDFQTQAKHPGPGSTSFTSATVLIALDAAREQGVKIPAALVEGGLKVIRLSRYPNGAFAYSIRTRLHPQMGVNQIKGSLARTPACLGAMAAFGVEVEDEAIVEALEALERHGHFLQIARKYPRPHEAWYQNSGYFTFYGYYYATGLFDLVEPEVRETHRKRIAARLVPLQEKNGSWWDYQLFGFHEAYGTGYVLLALGRCRR